MNRRLPFGRLTAFVTASALAAVVWSFVFVKGGVGANVVLGVLLAAWFIASAAASGGEWLDEKVFHGGSPARARLIRSALALARELRQHIPKRCENPGEEQRAERLRAARHRLRDVVARSCRRWRATPQEVRRQIEWLRQAVTAAEQRLRQDVGTPAASSWRGAVSLGLALAAALLLRICVLETYQIPSGSMIPTLLVGDHLFVSKWQYGLLRPFRSGYVTRWRDPRPGDVVIFTAPAHVGPRAGQTWIKRVIAGPGQRVSLRDGVVFVDGVPYAQTQRRRGVRYLDYDGSGWVARTATRTTEHIGDLSHGVFLQGVERGLNWPGPGTFRLPGLDCDWESCGVRPGHVFVMGDNRPNSSDGRVWGALPIDHVKGKALFIWMSVNGAGQLFEWGPFAVPRVRWSRLGNGIR
ncbi:MAG: signal peptidase I [Myxococcota bacterium]